MKFLKNKAPFYGIIALFLVGLPFNYSLTIDIGFPLKISEIAIGLFVIFNFEKLTSILKFHANHLFYVYFKIFLVFVIIVICSFTINAFWHHDYLTNISNIRYNPLLQSLFKTLYVLVIGLGTYISYLAFSSTKHSLFLCVLNIGCLLSALFGWYLFIFSINNWTVYILPGMDLWPQHGLYSFGHFIRCGTFKEGNYAGLYFICIFFTNLHFRKYFWALVALVGCIPTFSSMALFCLLIAGLVSFIYYALINRKFVLLPLLAVFGFFGIFIASQNTDIRFIVSKFIPTSNSQFKDANNSRIERVNLAKAAIDIAYDNPVLGIGLANFPNHFQHYNPSTDVNKRSIQYIPNNIYLEILSELGVVGLLVFLTLLAFLIKMCLTNGSYILFLGLFSIIIYFMAYPTFSILFIWVYFGIILSVKNKHANTY